nr:MAG TPA: intron associated endonuclease [Caudoviricetes sp.]
MYIYKITNSCNGKIYIGQTIKTVKQRWERHKYDSLNNRIDTHFSRAIRKYGSNSFLVEQIDTAKSKEELTLKEQYWIKFFDSINQGYNETMPIFKSGGNTYENKTVEELKAIRSKIQKSKIGGKNPNAKKVKCKNLKTNEEKHFNSMAEMQKYFNENNHQFISRRCLGRIKNLYKGEWAIGYEDSSYNQKFTPFKNISKSQKIFVTVLQTNLKKEFNSYAAAERFFKLKNKSLSGKAYQKGPIFFYKDKYKIEKI